MVLFTKPPRHAKKFKYKTVTTMVVVIWFGFSLLCVMFALCACRLHGNNSILWMVCLFGKLIQMKETNCLAHFVTFGIDIFFFFSPNCQLKNLIILINSALNYAWFRSISDMMRIRNVGIFRCASSLQQQLISICLIIKLLVRMDLVCHRKGAI